MTRACSIRFKGFGPYREEVFLDLESLPGPVVAIQGANGQGKTVLAELLGPGTLWRKTETRGTLVSLATARDAFLEAKIVNGQPWTIHHTADPVSRSGESFVFNASGKEQYEKGSVKQFDRWAAEHLPNRAVYMASQFFAQKTPGFLDLERSDRAALLLRALGVERVQRLAKGSREHEAEARALVQQIEARRQDEWDRADDFETVTLAIGQAIEAAGNADLVLADRRLALKDALAQVEAYGLARSEYDRLERERVQKLAMLNESQTVRRLSARDLEERIRNNRQVLEQGDAIRAAVGRIPELDALITDEQVSWTRCGSASTEAERAVDRHIKLEQAARGRKLDAFNRAEQLRTRLAARAEIEKAATQLPGLRAQLKAAADELEAAEARLEELRGQRVAGADDRVTGLRGALKTVRDDQSQEPRLVAADALHADDAAQIAAVEQPGQVAAAQRAIRDLKDRGAVLIRQVTDVERLAARADTLAAAQADLEAAERDERAASLEADVEAKNARDQRLVARDYALDVERHAKRTEEAAAERSKLEPLAKRAGPLEGATARLAELEPQLAQINAELLELERQIANTPGPVAPPPSPGPGVAHYQQQVTSAEDAARRAHQAAAVAEERLVQAQQSAARLAGLEAELAAAQLELSDWVVLSRDLGPDGLPQLENDGVGVEMTALANDLLHTCHGPRFTVQVITQRPDSKGERLLEDCDVMVLDSERGREAEGSSYSPGECVILNEALGLALTMIACKRGGLDRPTLVRDESGAALDPKNGPAWIAMLRRAAELVRPNGVDKILFISHTPELWALADSRIVVSDGKVEVQ